MQTASRREAVTVTGSAGTCLPLTPSLHLPEPQPCSKGGERVPTDPPLPRSASLGGVAKNFKFCSARPKCSDIPENISAAPCSSSPILQDRPMCNSKSRDYFSLPSCSLYKTLVEGTIITNSNKFNFISLALYERVKMCLSDLVYNVALVHIPLK